MRTLSSPRVASPANGLIRLFKPPTDDVFTNGALFAPRAQQGEGVARLRAAPARARRGRLSIKEKNAHDRHNAIHLG